MSLWVLLPPARSTEAFRSRISRRSVPGSRALTVVIRVVWPTGEAVEHPSTYYIVLLWLMLMLMSLSARPAPNAGAVAASSIDRNNKTMYCDLVRDMTAAA